MIKFRGDQDRLFSICRQLKWSQVYLAELVDSTPSTMNRYAQLEREIPEQIFNTILTAILDHKNKYGLDLGYDLGLSNESRINEIEARLKFLDKMEELLKNKI